MEIYKFNHVFDHVEVTLNELFGNKPEYKNVLFILGYNVIKDMRGLISQYPNHKVIIIQLEQLYKGSYWANEISYNNLKYAHEIWDYDRNNILFLREYFNLNARFFPMKYTESLFEIESVNKIKPDIDILFYGYLHERRAKVWFNLQKKFSDQYKMFNMFGIWGDELTNYISRSKIILNMHNSDIPRQEQVRIYYPVINNRCVLSEKSEYNYFGNAIVELPYEKLVDGAISLLKNDNWKKIALQSGDIFKNIKNTFKI
jgi:hypothetical protein